MAIQLIDKESWILSKLAYMNFKDEKGKGPNEYVGTSLKDFAEKFYVPPGSTPNEFGSYGGLTDSEQNEMLGEIASGKYANLSNLVLKDYANENTSTGSGFVGYAFSDGSPGGNPNDHPLTCYYLTRMLFWKR